MEVDSELLRAYRQGVDLVRPGLKAEYIIEFITRSLYYERLHSVNIKEAAEVVSEQLRGEERYFARD